jgi:hypothetical protein
MKMRNGANNAWITLYQLDGEWSTIAFENGTAAAPSIYFKDSGTDTGIYSPGTDQLAISIGGTVKATVDSSGRILVGTSSSTTGLEGQYARLQVIGNTTGPGGAYVTFARDEVATSITTDEMIARITFGNTGPAEFAYISCQADGTAGSGDYPGRLVFSTTADGAASPTERLRVDSNGFANHTGSIGRGAPVTKTGAFTVGIAENWLICNGTASITVTLPTASAWTGREIMLKTIAAFTVISASSNVVPLAGGAAGTAILAATTGKYATLVSDGSNWIIMQAN